MSSNKTFYLDFKSEESGTNYTGTFAIKRFTIRDRGAIAVRKVQLNGGLHSESNGTGVDEDTDNLHYMIAVLEVGLSTVPPWFKLEEIFEADLIGRLFREVIAFQDTFRVDRRTPEKGPGPISPSQEGSKPADQNTDRPRETPKVVEWEVQAALEP